MKTDKKSREKPVTVRFTADLVAKLKDHAAENGRSFNREVLWIIGDWFRRREEVQKIRVTNTLPPVLERYDDPDLPDQRKAQ